MTTRNSQLFIEKEKLLAKNEIPSISFQSIFNGAAYFEHCNGVELEDYWKSEKFNNRDEYFVVLNSYFGLIGVLNKLTHKNEWRLKFDVAYLFQLKANAQSSLALNILTSKHCYTDAFSVCRTMISRLNLTLLCAFNTNLFDEWLKNPNQKKFVDGNIRKELERMGISTVPHLYKFSSDIIHNQFYGLADTGYFEQGLFPEILAVDNQIWVTAKFIMGMTYTVILSMALQDLQGFDVPTELQGHVELLKWFKTNYFVSNRLDHMWTFIAEDRHWKKINDNEYQIGGSFDFDELQKQISLFYSKQQ